MPWPVGPDGDDLIGTLSGLFQTAKSTVSPLILDLDGDGIETVGLAADLHFDHDGNGFAEQTGWVGRDDGLLVLDRNGNGAIDSGTELFGNNSALVNGSKAPNGFDALAELDGNHDDIIDGNDAAFAELRVWKDGNSNGIADTGELLTLTQAGVQSLATGYTNSSTVDANGNAHKQIGAFTKTDGGSASLTDVWFASDLARTVDQNLVAVDAAIAALPEVAGFGNVHSLRQAMATDASGHLQALVAQYTVTDDPIARAATVANLIYAWAGVEGIAPNSRGSYLPDARKLAALEAFMGQGFIQGSGTNAGTNNPGGNSANVLLQAFDTLIGYVEGQLLPQTRLKPLFDSIGLRWNSSSGEVALDVSPTVALLQADYALDPVATQQRIQELVHGLKAMGAPGIDLLLEIHAHGDLNGDSFAVQIASMGYTLQRGDAANNALSGNGGYGMLMGEAGNDTLTGVGHSLLLGGAGDDVYVVTGLTDIIIEEANSGIDTVQSAASHTLADNVENLTLTGSGSVNGTGNALDNVIVGGTGKNILLGLAGNDSVTFGASSNTVDGGSGNDLIKVASQTYRYQYNSVNTLQGGTGDDRIESGNSADTYLFNRGDGRDTINDNDAYGYGKTDRIVFGNGITQGDLSGYRMGNHLVLRINDATNPTASDQITVEDWYVSTQYQIESLQFADGSSLSAVQLTALCNNVYGTGAADTINGFADNNTIYGLDGDDIITDIGGTNVMYGGAGNDTVTYAIGSSNSVDGGSGNDLIRVASQTYRYQYNSVNTLQGGTGDDRIESGNSADTYLFNRGDGRDTINDYDYYGYGKTDKIAFGAGIGQGDLIGTRVGNNLVLKINDPANTSVTDQITVENWFTSSQYQIESFQFADGSTLSAPQVTVLGNNLYGTDGADTLSGFADNNNIHGLDGNDTITDSYGSDMIDGGAGDDMIIDQGAGTNVLRGGAGNDTITFSCDANNTIDGGSGNDLIKVATYHTGSSSYNSSNTFQGGVGNDRIESSNGTDTYLFNRGDGQDIISDTDHGVRGKADRIVFAAGISLSDVSLSRVGSHLVLKVNDPADPSVTDQITVENWFASLQYQIESFQFADGSTLSAPQVTVLGNNLYGTDGADTLSGYSDNNNIHGLNGNDTITDSYGSDMIDGGAGDDMIIDQGAGTNVLRGGAGNDTITFSCDANNTIDGGSGNDLIKVATYHTGSSSYNSSNTFQGGAGNDRIESSNGTDTYLFNRGDGQDIISDTDHGVRGKADRIVFAAGISLSDVSLSRVGSHLVLKVNDPADPSVTDQITVENWFASLQYQIESFQFADGSTLSAPQVTVLGNNLYGTDGADTLTGVNGYAGTICGLGGNDTLTGTYSNDTLDGGIGLDTLSGGSGNDTYVLGRDYGADLIRENDTTAGNTDVAKFMSGIATDQIWLRHVGNNLEASIIGTSDKLTIENWYTGNAYHVEQFKTADGKTLIDSNVEALVQAMAAFAPPSAGQSTLPQNYQDALGGVIAANWQ